MEPHHSSRLALITAATTVVVSLAALVILPLIISNRTMRVRASLGGHSAPARSQLNEISALMGEQIAALTRAIATDDIRYVGKYRGLIDPQDEALAALEKHRGYLGPGYDDALDLLEERLDLWHGSVDQSITLNSLMFDASYTRVVEAIRGLEQAITRFETSRQHEVGRLARAQLWVTAALVLIAATAAAIVLWMAVRLRTLAAALHVESAGRQEALERQQQLVRNRDQILGVVSHDLRTPLTTIALSTRLIPESSPNERNEHVDMILATTQRMERLIQDLLDVTRIDHGKLSVREDSVGIPSLVDEVIDGHRSIASSKEIRLESAIDRDVPEIRGDRDRLAQTLDNLIGNAFKFTPAGGVVTLTVASQNGRVRFEVSDTGPGIDPTDLPHLFEPFWQADDQAHLGAGLGLKIARGIVEAHGGRMEVVNRPEGGATFAFELPSIEK